MTAKVWGLRKLSRRQLLLVALAALVLGGGFFWFRSSSFVSVQQVRLQGVSGTDSAAVEAALTEAAKRMSTMDASAGALEAAVARLHVVRSVAIFTSFPHTMRIAVREQLPVAVLGTKSAGTAVAADGVVLGPALVSRSLPHIATKTRLRTGANVGQARLRAYLTLLGAAPAPLLPLVRSVYVGKYGLTAKLQGGLLVYFGNVTRPHAKWDSLAAVLANRESKGAVYVDVRVPERPAAGMANGEGEAGETGEVSATDSTSAALAASLARALDGEKPIEATNGESAVQDVPEEASAEPTTQGATAGGTAEDAAGVETSVEAEAEAADQPAETATAGG